jgi:hypothetical protein
MVKDLLGLRARNRPITERNSDKGRSKMGDLLDWLHISHELERTYFAAVQEDNCQGFARRLFKKFTKTNNCETEHLMENTSANARRVWVQKRVAVNPFWGARDSKHT